jgi:transposase
MTELLPPTWGIRLTDVIVADQSVQVRLTTTRPTALCPDCTTPSSSVHSHYQRQLADLPWGARAVHLQLFVRKFVEEGVTRIQSPERPQFQ